MADISSAPQADPIMGEATPQSSSGVNIYDISGEQPVLGSMPPEDVTQAVASGMYSLPQGQMVQVVSPDGVLGNIPSEDAPKAFQNGYRHATQKDIDLEKYSTPGQMLATGVEGAMQGLTGPVGAAIETGLGISSPEAQRKRAEINPGIHTASEIGGFIAPSIATLGASGAASLGVQGAAEAAQAINAAGKLSQAGLVGQAGEAAAKAMGLSSDAASLATRLASGGTKMATEMALLQADDEGTKYIQEDPKQNVESALTSIGAAGLLGAGFGTAASGVGELWKASGAREKLIQALGKIKDDANGLPVGTTAGESLPEPAVAAISSLTNMSKSDVRNYAAARAAVNNAPESEEIFNHMLDHVEAVNQNVADKTIEAKDAGEAYSQLIKAAQDEYKQQGYESRQALSMAKRDLDSAQKKLAEDSLNNNLNQAGPISQGIEQLRQNVVNGSAGAYDALERSGKSIDLGDFAGQGLEHIKDLRSKGTIESNAMADRLEQYLADKTGSIAAPEAKKLIQGLDSVSKYDFNASSFDKGISPYYKQLRHTLDDSLKTAVPEYAELMKPIAQDAQLLKSLNRYGTEEGATTALKGIKDPARYKNEMPMLRELEQRLGGDFTSKIEPYANPEMRANMIKALPEYAEHEKYAAINQAMKDPKLMQAQKEALVNSAEHKAMVKAQEEKALAMLQKKELGVTAHGLEGLMKKAALGNPGAMKLLEKFPQFQGKSVAEMAQMARLKAVFEKGSATNGSRNVNLFAGLLGGLGGLLSHIPGASMFGLSSGAGLGALVDKYGPQMAKFAVDKYMDKFGSLSKFLGIENKGAIRAMLGKMLDKDAASSVNGSINIGRTPDADKFKSAVEYIHNAQKGQLLIDRATKSVLHPDIDKMPISEWPTESQRNSLSKHVQKFQEVQGSESALNALDKITGKVGHYLPEHGDAMNQMSQNIVSYLQGQKPTIPKTGILDSITPISPADKAQYNRTLDIAQQPLVILNHIKQGTLTPKDVQDMRMMYPALYSKLTQTLMSNVIEHTSKGKQVAYKTRLGLTLFLGQPMDSTLTQGAILGAQPMPRQSNQPNTSPSAAKTKELNKMPSMSQTPGQAREAQKQKPE